MTPPKTVTAPGLTAEAFWLRVDKSGGPDACWPWMGSRNREGYGTFSHCGKNVRANRHALSMSLGRPLAAEECSLHSCDNPPCVNPKHLRAGTVLDNNRDAAAKGRRALQRGEKATNVKLTAAQVVELRRRNAAGESKKALGREFGLHATTIHYAITGRNWASVPR